MVLCASISIRHLCFCGIPKDWAQNFYPDGRLMRSASPADRCLAVDYTMVKSAGWGTQSGQLVDTVRERVIDMF